MNFLRTFWPTPFKVEKGNVASLIVQLVIFLVICAVVGWLIGLLSAIPIIGILFGLVGALMELYSLVGIIVCILLKLPHNDFVQLYKRMLFNEFAKNFDDHTKNIAFLMDKKGVWRLAPAYDMTFSYNKTSHWVQAHQMLINGKADEITEDDLIKVAEIAGIKTLDAKKHIHHVKNVVSQWSDFAEQSGLSKQNADRINTLLNS